MHCDIVRSTFSLVLNFPLQEIDKIQTGMMIIIVILYAVIRDFINYARWR